MREQDYPPQEPLSARAMPYRNEALVGSFGVAFHEFRYGEDPYQSLAVYPAERPNGIMLAFVHGGGLPWILYMGLASRSAVSLVPRKRGFIASPESGPKRYTPEIGTHPITTSIGNPWFSCQSRRTANNAV